MTDRFVGAFVDKLLLLETRAGRNTQYRVMAPFTMPFHDSIEIQKAAKHIAEFVGLANYTFIIAIAKQKEKVGGHIDLSTGGTEVFIEIDENTLKYPDAVAATLCHEVCHKWLHKNSIILSPVLENEILTDITSVYLGFGKIMLNGCRTSISRTEPIVDGTRTITDTLSSGYIDRDQFAFAYCLVCAMRNIPSRDCLQDLNNDAIVAVRNCERQYGHHFNSKYHRPETSLDTISEFKNMIYESQYKLAELDRHMTYVKKSFCKTVSDHIKSKHKALESIGRTAVVTQHNDSEPNPVMRFLSAIRLKCQVSIMGGDIVAISHSTQNLRHVARSISKALLRENHLFPTATAEMFNIVECPRDGTKLRLPLNTGDLIATCPTCKYRFGYNTTVLSSVEDTDHQKSRVVSKSSLWGKLRTYFRRILNWFRT